MVTQFLIIALLSLTDSYPATGKNAKKMDGSGSGLQPAGRRAVRGTALRLSRVDGPGAQSRRLP